jgi:hypothetical protein
VKLGDLRPGHKAYIERMSFTVTIRYNPSATPYLASPLPRVSYLSLNCISD